MDEIFEHEGYMIFEATYEMEHFFIASETALDALGIFVQEAEEFYDYMHHEMTVSIKPLTNEQVETLGIEVYHEDEAETVSLKQEFLFKFMAAVAQGLAAFAIGYAYQR